MKDRAGGGGARFDMNLSGGRLNAAGLFILPKLVIVAQDETGRGW